MLAQLRELEEDVWPSLSRSMGARETTAFGQRIGELGRAADCDTVADYGRELAEAAGSFQLSKTEKLLQHFPSRLEAISRKVIRSKS